MVLELEMEMNSMNGRYQVICKGIFGNIVVLHTQTYILIYLCLYVHSTHFTNSLSAHKGVYVYTSYSGSQNR